MGLHIVRNARSGERERASYSRSCREVIKRRALLCAFNERYASSTRIAKRYRNCKATLMTDRAPSTQVPGKMIKAKRAASRDTVISIVVYATSRRGRVRGLLLINLANISQCTAHASVALQHSFLITLYRVSERPDTAKV